MEDDQGEHTDPTLDYAVRTGENPGHYDIPTSNPTSPQAGETGRNGDAPPSFQTPTMPAAPTTDFPRT
eukprot:5416372-Pleurochrysis_carterae.AAC.1